MTNRLILHLLHSYKMTQTILLCLNVHNLLAFA
uniref:Uncharacterized protein n=1 Tax=Anguilla anguilla TaxID=7936 RepID=A0A0E9QQ42_ANGAN